jgi:ribosome-binding protein aMBF1 (putative translation factor)
MTPAKRVSSALAKARTEIFAALSDATTGDPPSHGCQTFGDFIRENRELLGYSLQDLATKAGCTKAHIWDIEDGRAKNPTVKTVRGLAKGLGIPVMSVFSAALNP